VASSDLCVENPYDVEFSTVEKWIWVDRKMDLAGRDLFKTESFLIVLKDPCSLIY
jgi:hypothetical protein